MRSLFDNWCFLLDVYRGRLGFPELKQKAIDLYQHYKDNPKQAGNKIRGLERTGSIFAAGNNCKDPAIDRWLSDVTRV